MTPKPDRRIDRAWALIQRFPEARDLLTFYTEVVAFQQPLLERFRSATTLADCVPFIDPLHHLFARIAPKPLPPPANPIQALQSCWTAQPQPDSDELYARILLQPYAESASLPTPEPAAALPPSRCPRCNHRPVVAVLRGEGDGAKRSLICSLCSHEWLHRRVLCPFCGQEDKDRLPVYTVEGVDWVRIQACDACGAYIKAVDLSRDGHAVPLVDEIATVALAIWAEEHGYAKGQPNLLGM